MKKQIQSNRILVILLASVFVLQTIVIGYLLVKTNTLTNKFDEVSSSLIQQTAELYNQKSLQRPVVLAKEKLVAFPELGVSLPHNDITKTLQYSYDGEDMRVTSSLLNDYKIRQMSCLGLVRINMKNGSAFSPWEENAGSVKLPDGRTLHIVAAKAFKNNEASTEDCAKEVWAQITPTQVVDAFKAAKPL